MELTPMQATYWAGREAGGTCGGVSAHLYAELDCTGLDPDRLSHATKELIRAHPMLRMRITPAGQQVIQPLRADHDLVVEDLSQLDPVSADQQLLAKRQRMTHQKLPLDQGRTAEIGLTLLPGGAQRLHVDLDMIAADPSCFGLLLEDLASLYEEPGRRLRATGGCYFDYLKRLAERPGSEAAARADRDWWRDRMGEIPPAPDLPWLADAGTLPPRTDRLSAVIDRPRAESLRRTARGLQVTPTALFLALFAAMLGQATGSRRFRLNLPGFFREPILPGADRLAGDFTRLALFSAEADPAQTLAEEARRA